MPKDPNIQFKKLVYEVFGSIIRNYGLIVEENRNLLIARKGDVELIFRLEAGPLFYYFGLEVRIYGELGEKATLDLQYRHLSVDVIAKSLDSSYKPSSKGAQTEQELREMLERDKEELFTKYCERILLGDVSFWPKVVDYLKEKKKKRGL